MSILQVRKARLFDFGIPSQLEVPVERTTRFRLIEFLGDGSIRLIYDVFLGEFKQSPIVIELREEMQPEIPEEDKLDENGEVEVKRGSIRQAIPSVSDVMGLPLPGGKVEATTFGELVDSFRRQVYLASMRLNSDWSDGQEG